MCSVPDILVVEAWETITHVRAVTRTGYKRLMPQALFFNRA